MGVFRPKRRTLVDMEVVDPDKVDERSVLYRSTTGEGVMFHTFKERKEALDSGDWVTSPALCGKQNDEGYNELVKEEMIIAGIEFEEEEEPENALKEDVNYAERLNLRDSNLPPEPRYISQMRVDELVELGKEWGFNFSDPEDRPTRPKMREMIKEAAKAKGVEIV